MVYPGVIEDDAFAVLEFGIQRRLQDGEELGEVLRLVTELARIRSERRERPVDAFEISLVAAALCWWPLRPKPPEEYQVFAFETRFALLRSSREAPVETWEAEVPPHILIADPQSLMDIIRAGPPRRFFT